MITTIAILALGYTTAYYMRTRDKKIADLEARIKDLEQRKP